jgi:hypothetical protein
MEEIFLLDAEVVICKFRPTIHIELCDRLKNVRYYSEEIFLYEVNLVFLCSVKKTECSEVMLITSNNIIGK